MKRTGYTISNELSLARVRQDPKETTPRSDLEVFKLLRRVFTYARPHARTRNWLFFNVIIRSVMLPCVAWAVGLIINGPITNGDLTGLVWSVSGFFALVAVVQIGFHYRMRLGLELGEAVIHDVRRALFAHLLTLTMSYYDRTKLGRIVGRVTSDLDAIRTGVQDVVFVSAVQVGQMLVSALLMLWYDWVLFLLVLAGAPVVWVLNRAFKSRITEMRRMGQESFSRVTAAIAESVNGIRVTQGFVRQETNAGFFRRLVSDHSRYNVSAGHTSAVFLPLLELNSQIFIAMLLLVGGYRALDPEIARPVGDIIAFFFLANLFFDPIKIIGNQYNKALVAMVGAERVFRLLDTKPDWRDPQDAVKQDSIEGRVAFDHVTFGYDPRRPVLHDVSFTASPGQTIALVGHTGSGKTSIINLVAKMYLPTAGTLTIDGVDITRLDSASLHRSMGVVQQHSFLFEGSVLDNIRFACPQAPIQRIIAALRQLDCLDMFESLSHGLRTEVGEAGGNLSSGQRQLVSFVRAMIVDPSILILDEATSAIDAVTETQVQKALAKLTAGRTCFVVAHRLSTIRAADLILVLDQGRIVERGTHAELLSNAGTYAQLHTHFSQLA